MKKSRQPNRWLQLALGSAALLFAGMIYAWSILKGPLAEDFGWTAGELAFNFTLTMCFFCLGGLVSGLLSKRLSARLRLLVSALLVLLGFYVSSRLDGGSLAPLYLAYGVCAGTGIGIVYNTVIAAVSAWFPDKKGLCSGVLMMAFGFSTLIIGNAAGRAIVSIGWRETYLVLGIATAAVLAVSAFLIKTPPAPERQAGSAGGQEGYTAGQMLRRASFWKLFLFFIALASVGSSAISFAKDFALYLGAGEGLAVTLVGVTSVCNGLGRLCSGSVFDALGLRRTQYITSAVAILGPLTALAALPLGSAALGVAGLCICGFSYGFAPTLTAAAVSEFYGQRSFSLNFSIMNLILIPASFSATIAGSMQSATNSYASTFVMLLALSAVGLAINLSIKKA